MYADDAMHRNRSDERRRRNRLPIVSVDCAMLHWRLDIDARADADRSSAVADTCRHLFVPRFEWFVSRYESMLAAWRHIVQLIDGCYWLSIVAK